MRSDQRLLSVRGIAHALEQRSETVEGLVLISEGIHRMMARQGKSLVNTLMRAKACAGCSSVLDLMNDCIFGSN